MGIFDIFKTRVNVAAEKAGDMAGQAKDRVSEMVDKKKGGTPEDPASHTPTGTVPGAEAATDARAANMVYEGGPVSSTGEAAPGVGDDGFAPQAAPPAGSRAGSGGTGGMTQSIRANVASGADEAGERAKGATGNRFDERIDSGTQEAKDRLR